MNASGRCAKALNLEVLKTQGLSYPEHTSLPDLSVHTITVPGAASGWVECVSRFGSGNLSLRQILQPAIDLAENGFPVSDVTAAAWKASEDLLRSSCNGHELLLNGYRAPEAGELMTNSNLAKTLRILGEQGVDGFYGGVVAKAIVSTVKEQGGLLSMEDLQEHRPTLDTPITTRYRGVDVWEIPPNGQGITALIALNILEGFHLSKVEHNSPQHLHFLIECLRLAFADTRWYCADPSQVHVPVEELLSKDYAKVRRGHIDPAKAKADISRGTPVSSSDTVYFGVVDENGLACSFINSNYMGFGTGIVPKGFGFTLQNRGANFSLNPEHPNHLAPRKRPYHTIIPGMATKDGNLFACFGVMGGFMQPQGHVQVLSNMIDFGMTPQEALDAPRICIADGTCHGQVYVEEGISEETIASLAASGHAIYLKPVTDYSREVFGRGQVIQPLSPPSQVNNRVLCAGSDPRADGCAIPQI